MAVESYPLVLISQIQRSGGTLLIQLLDGHPEVMVHHSELHWGKPAKYFWPRVDLQQAPSKLFETLKEVLSERFSTKGYSKGSPNADTKPDVFPFELDLKNQKDVFLKYLQQHSPSSPREVLDAYVCAYFEAWRNYDRPSKPTCWAAFAARMLMMPGQIERFFHDYPDGKFISIVRDPVSWFASAKKHEPTIYGELRESVYLWQCSTVAALQLKQKFARKVLLVRFEDLVADTQTQMRHMCEFLHIDWAPSLLSPTFNGNSIRADTSFSAEKPGMLVQAVDRRAFVDDIDIRRIERDCKSLHREALDVIARQGQATEPRALRGIRRVFAGKTPG